MKFLLQRVSVLLSSIIDNPAVPDDIREVASELEVDVDDAINDNYHEPDSDRNPDDDQSNS